MCTRFSGNQGRVQPGLRRLVAQCRRLKRRKLKLSLKVRPKVVETGIKRLRLNVFVLLPASEKVREVYGPGSLFYTFSLLRFDELVTKKGNMRSTMRLCTKEVYCSFPLQRETMMPPPLFRDAGKDFHRDLHILVWAQKCVNYLCTRIVVVELRNGDAPA